MRSRYLMVAIQVVAVAVIAGIVYTAVLQPSDPIDLSGIDADSDRSTATGPVKPEGPRGAENDIPGDKGERSRGDRRPGGRDEQAGPEDQRDPAGSRDGDTRSGLPRSTPPAAPGSSDYEGGWDSPSASQYRDSVSRLLEQVGAP